MPHLQNCPHSGDGWCLDCVQQLHESHDTWVYAHTPLCMMEKKDLANAIADREIAQTELAKAAKRWRDVAEEQPEEGQKVEYRGVGFARSMTGFVKQKPDGSWWAKDRPNSRSGVSFRVWLWRPSSP